MYQIKNIRIERPIWGYGLALGLALFVIKQLEYTLLIEPHDWELPISIVAVLFTGLGLWLSRHLNAGTTMVDTCPQGLAPQPLPAATDVSLSSREQQVLQLMAEGLSNKEIADRLFISQNTVKTHAASIFDKLEVKRRTQAVEKARKLLILY